MIARVYYTPFPAVLAAPVGQGLAMLEAAEDVIEATG